MLDFVIFAATFAVVLLLAVFYLYPGSRKTGTTIPGMDPSDPKEGNWPDIRHAGSVHEFLSELHEKYGPIASFWLESKLAVSLASPDLFNEHQHTFDRPGELFEAFKPLFGKNSIFYANGTCARQENRIFGDILSQASNAKYCTIYREMAMEIVGKLETIPPDQHVPLHQFMMALAIKSLLITMFGDSFRDTNNVLELSRSFKICMLDIEKKINGKGLDENITQTKKVENAIEDIREHIKKVIRSKKGQASDDFAGVYAETYSKMKGSEDQLIDNAITLIYQGYQTTGTLLTWLMYYVTMHKNIHAKLVKEIEQVIGSKSITEQLLSQLSYLRQVIDETLRISCLHPFAARSQDIDVELGGHLIPKNTPIFHALGVVSLDEKHWTSPNQFDPERFSKEQAATRSALAFSPFGFAGRRICPGKSFVYSLVSIGLIEIVRHVEMTLVDSQEARPTYGVVTQPDSEIWVSIKKRLP